MGGFFSMEGSFYRFGSMLADIVLLSLIWLLFSLPLFTVGASTCALFYVTTRRIANREGYLFRDFWTGFKANLKKGTAIWLILAALVGMLAFYFFNIDLMTETIGSAISWMIPAWFVILAELAILSVFLFPIAARFDMGFLQIVKSALFMANRHILTSITCVILALAIVLGVFLYPVLILFAMGLYAWLSSYLIMRVFKRYRPEMDKDPTLEAAEESKQRG